MAMTTNAIPFVTLRVSVDNEPAIPVRANVTGFIPSSGYTSGDYGAYVADSGVWIKYSACGVYRADFNGELQVRTVPFDGPVRFDFTEYGGPVVLIECGPCIPES